MKTIRPRLRDEASEHSAEGGDNLAAANEFFSKQAAESKPAETKPAETKPAETKPAETKPVEPKIPQLVKGKETKPAETKPAETKAPEAPSFDKLVGPDEKSKHRPDWDKMKAAASEHYTARTAAESRVKELEAQLAARGPAQADDASKALITQLQAQIKDYDARLKVHDLKGHPEFQKQYIQPQQQAIASINQALQLEGVEGADVAKILALEGKSFVAAVSELLPKLSEFNRPVVAQAFRQAKQLQADATAALGKVDELRTQYQNDFAARSRAAFEQVGAQFADTLVQRTAAEGASEAEVAAVTAYNTELAALGKKAEALAFGQTSEAGVSEMAHKAVRFDFMVNHAIPTLVEQANAVVAARDARIADLEKQIKDLTDASPRISGGAGDSGDGHQKQDAPADHLAAAQKFFQS